MSVKFTLPQLQPDRSWTLPLKTFLTPDVFTNHLDLPFMYQDSDGWIITYQVQVINNIYLISQFNALLPGVGELNGNLREETIYASSMTIYDQFNTRYPLEWVKIY